MKRKWSEAGLYATQANKEVILFRDHYDDSY